MGTLAGTVGSQKLFGSLTVRVAAAVAAAEPQVPVMKIRGRENVSMLSFYGAVTNARPDSPLST